MEKVKLFYILFNILIYINLYCCILKVNDDFSTNMDTDLFELHNPICCDILQHFICLLDKEIKIQNINNVQVSPLIGFYDGPIYLENAKRFTIFPIFCGDKNKPEEVKEGHFMLALRDNGPIHDTATADPNINNTDDSTTGIRFDHIDTSLGDTVEDAKKTLCSICDMEDLTNWNKVEVIAQKELECGARIPLAAYYLLQFCKSKNSDNIESLSRTSEDLESFMNDNPIYCRSWLQYCIKDNVVYDYDMLWEGVTKLKGKLYKVWHNLHLEQTYSFSCTLFLHLRYDTGHDGTRIQFE